MKKLTENVFLGTNMPGCNSCFLVTTAGVVVIDTPPAPADAKKWRQEAEQYGEIKYVINCDPHRDHVAGNCWMGGTLIAHEGIRQIIKGHSVELLEEHLKWLVPDALPLDKDFRYRLPDITFSGDLTLYMGKHIIQLLYLPGHTPSMTAVFVPEERILFASDNVVVGMPVLFDAVPDEWLKSLKKMEALEVDIIVPGHGNVCDKSQIKVQYDNIQYMMDEVKTAVDKGWSLEETQEKLTFADRFELTWADAKQLLLEGIARLYTLQTEKK